jgi:hypothetical protein
VNDDTTLIRLVDGLEDKAEGYLTLEKVEQAYGGKVAQYIAEGVLLVDYRTRLDGTPVTLCRLNRHHPLVMKLTSW